MDFFVFPALVALLMLIQAAALLPYLMLRDHKLARIRRRSVYAKTTIQVARLGMTVQIFLAAALSADWLMGGGLYLSLTSHWRLLGQSIVVALWLSGLGSILFLFLQSAGPLLQRLAGWFSLLIALVAAVLSLVLFWYFLQNTFTAPTNASAPILAVAPSPSSEPGVDAASSPEAGASSGVSPDSGTGSPDTAPGSALVPNPVPTPDSAVSPTSSIPAPSFEFSLANLWIEFTLALPVLVAVFNAWVPFLYLIIGLLLGPLGALALTLCAVVLRRRADDYGRDYYLFATTWFARQAAYSGAFLLPFCAALLWLAPEYSPNHIATLLPPFLHSVSLSTARIILNLGTLGLLLAVLCWYVLVRSPNPLRRKSLLFLAPILLWIGITCLFARLWV